MLLFEAVPHILYKIYIKKRLKTLFLNFYCFYSIEPQMSTIHLFGFFFKKTKKGKIMHGIIMFTKTKGKKKRKKWFTKAIYFIYN